MSTKAFTRTLSDFYTSVRPGCSIFNKNIDEIEDKIIKKLFEANVLFKAIKTEDELYDILYFFVCLNVKFNYYEKITNTMLALLIASVSFVKHTSTFSIQNLLSKISKFHIIYRHAIIKSIKSLYCTLLANRKCRGTA